MQVVQILYRYLRRTELYERPSRSSRVFGVASIALGTAFIASTILLVTSTVLKLQYACYGEKAGVGDVLDASVVEALDTALGGLFQLMILLADTLLVSCCSIILSHTHNTKLDRSGVPMLSRSQELLVLDRHSAVCASTPRLFRWVFNGLWLYTLRYQIIGFFLVFLVYRRDLIFAFATTVTSLSANLIVTPALISWIWRSQTEVESLLGNAVLAQTQVPYNRVVRILTESALPPLLLGFLNISLAVSGNLSVVFTILWVIFTVRYQLLNLFVD
jgi:hypothetical protein